MPFNTGLITNNNPFNRSFAKRLNTMAFVDIDFNKIGIVKSLPGKKIMVNSSRVIKNYELVFFDSDKHNAKALFQKKNALCGKWGFDFEFR